MYNIKNTSPILALRFVLIALLECNHYNYTTKNAMLGCTRLTISQIHNNQPKHLNAHSTAVIRAFTAPFPVSLHRLISTPSRLGNRSLAQQVQLLLQKRKATPPHRALNPITHGLYSFIKRRFITCTTRTHTYLSCRLIKTQTQTHMRGSSNTPTNQTTHIEWHGS